MRRRKFRSIDAGAHDPEGLRVVIGNHPSVVWRGQGPGTFLGKTRARSGSPAALSISVPASYGCGQKHDGMLTIRQMHADDIRRLHVEFTKIGWIKPEDVFARYLAEAQTDRRWMRVAEWGKALAGYVTVVWESDDPIFRASAIPEIVDLNVLPAFRGRGVGSRLLDAAEAAVRNRSDIVGLRVGLHAGYGAAQRLYVRRGYLPDGQGAVKEGASIPEEAVIALNDDVTLRMTKHLGGISRDV